MRFKYKSAGNYKLEIAKSGDVGYDLKSTEEVLILAGDTKKIDTGIQLELPEGYEAQVRPKSGISLKGILIHFGTVDNGFRGTVGVTITNLTSKTIKIENKEKIAQLVIKKYEYDALPVEVIEINENTERGEDGYGSTGRF